MSKRKQSWQLTMDDYETLYPKAGDTVDGYKVRDDVPNMDSIYSSIDTPTIVKGVREVSMKEFRGYKPKFYSVDEGNRTRELAKELKKSKEIAPLIVVYDSEGAYILEGGHRFDALRLNKVKSFPAKVVFDEDSIYDSVKEAVAQGKKVPRKVLMEYGRVIEGTWAGKKPWEMTKDEYNKYRGVVYHQTSKQNAEKIEKEGFKLDYPVARRGDDRMPDAVFFKPTTADIGVGAIDDDVAQVDAYVKKGNVKEFRTTEKLRDYLEQDPQYKELYYQSWLDDRRIAKEMNKLSDEYFSGERRHKSPEEHKEFDSKFSSLKEQAYIAPTKARERATAYLKEQGVDTVIVKDDVGSFGRRVTTVAALDPKKIKPYLHKQVVREAMKRGKSVPDSVLKDYADLYQGKKTKGAWATEVNAGVAKGYRDNDFAANAVRSGRKPIMLVLASKKQATDFVKKYGLKAKQLEATNKDANGKLIRNANWTLFKDENNYNRLNDAYNKGTYFDESGNFKLKHEAHADIGRALGYNEFDIKEWYDKNPSTTQKHQGTWAKETVYHGGRDIGDKGTLKFGMAGRAGSGYDAGAIFVTPSKKYAQAYVKPEGKLYRTKIDLDKEKIFDATNPAHLNKLKSITNDQTVELIKDSISHGAADWATLSQFTDEINEAGYTGAKFLERPAEDITQLHDGSFKLKGKPVYSYGLFHEVPVKYAPLPLQRSARLHKKVRNASIKVGRIK